MSTKTLLKRIALVAVSALTAGLVSVVSAPVASAALGNATNVSTNVTTGVAAASTGGTAGSVGLLAESGEGTTQTAVLLATGAINVYLADDSEATTTASATVTGGRFTLVANGTISSRSSTVAYAAATDSAFGLVAVPNSGATSMVITFYQDTATTSTVSKRITVTVVATSAYNKYSATYSRVYWGASGTYSATTDATSTNYIKEREGVIAGEILLADAYGNALTSANTGILQATVTGDAVVNLGSASVAGDNSTDFMLLDDSATYVFNIQQADTDAPANGTVTITFGGTVVATKSYVIKGEVAKVTVASPKIGSVPNSPNTGAALIKYEDSAGNQVLPSSGTSTVSGTTGAVVTAASVGTYSSSLTDAYGGLSLLTVTCATSGTQKGLQLQHLNASGTVVKSNVWDHGCAGAPYSMTASLDKASYKRGEVATLTLTVKDANGNPGNAYDTIVATDVANLTLTGMPGTIVTAVAVGDKLSYSTGAKTYQFSVTLDDGSYNAIVVPTTIKGNNALQANLTVPFSVTSVSTGVTNAEVLAAVVKLIASINKQIKALQKALLKR